MNHADFDNLLHSSRIIVTAIPGIESAYALPPSNPEQTFKKTNTAGEHITQGGVGRTRTLRIYAVFVDPTRASAISRHWNVASASQMVLLRAEHLHLCLTEGAHVGDQQGVSAIPSALYLVQMAVIGWAPGTL